MKLPQMDSVWQNPEVKKSSVLRDWGTGFGGFMGNPVRQQEENLFFYFKSFYKRICVCVCVCVWLSLGNNFQVKPLDGGPA